MFDAAYPIFNRYRVSSQLKNIRSKDIIIILVARCQPNFCLANCPRRRRLHTYAN